jgi:NDP-4-keto-2,6-dideoxyhexose 3-C-methyltransferase
MLLQNLTYDQICHEHVTYYTLEVFKNIATKNGLKILDFNFNEINGGSIEIYCCKNTAKYKATNKKIKELISKEKKINYEDYKRFQIRIDNIKDNVNNFLSLIKSSKNIQVLGYGASTKGNVVLNHCGITNDNLKYIADANIEKFGKYTPGSNIKIISKKLMRLKKPDYLFVLIWSFRKEVIKQELKYLKQGGKLYFHLPIPHIVTYKNYKKYLNNDFTSLSYALN